ncbi:MAG: hypothetical protein QXJ31_02740 [Candidatus Bathyarchaeia archaeon]
MRKVKGKVHRKLQPEILKFLAENGPASIYAVCTKTKEYSLKDWNAIYHAFQSLMKKGLVEKVGRGKYRVTSEGRLTALLYGANIRKVKENALKNCKPEDREDLLATYEIIESVGPEVGKALIKVLKGKMELAYLPIPVLNDKEFTKILAVLKKYPKWWQTFENMTRETKN